MSNLRMLLVLPFVPFLFIGLAIVYVFGIPMLILGGQHGERMFDEITKMIKD